MLQHSYSQTSVELDSQNLVKLYNKTSILTTAQQLPHLSRAREPKLGQIIHKTSQLTTAQLLQGSSGARTKIRSNYTHDKAYMLQHNHSQTSVELERKNLIKLYKTKPNTTAQLLQGSSGARVKIWSNYTQDNAYMLQDSHSQTSVVLESQNLVKSYTR